MQHFILKCLKSTQNWLLPPCCPACHHKSNTPDRLCLNCEAALSQHLYACQQCGIALMQDHLCGYCQKNPPRFDRTITIGDYKAPLSTLVTQLKYQSKLGAGRVLANLLLTELKKAYPQQNYPELIIPVPLHTKRLRRRGFNQAVEIAKPLAKALNIPLSLHHCARQKNTATQMALPKKSRYKNLKNAFKLKTDITQKHVAIVDDVMTTSHTANELAKLLKRQGCQWVDVWCCARTQLDDRARRWVLH